MLHKGEVFVDRDIVLDGNAYEECEFINCRMHYSGGNLPTIQNCKWPPSSQWIFDGAAGNTLTLLQSMSHLTPRASAAFETLMEAIQKGDEPQEDKSDDEINFVSTFYFLDNHGQHAVTVAKIAARFSCLEFQMCQVFCWMLQCPPMNAAAAYYRLVNWKARVDMLRGLMTYLHSDNERQVISKIILLATESAAIRNKYCHALWRVNGDKVYLTENLDTHFPHGTKRLITFQTIVSEYETVKKTAMKSQ